jgi:uroporphyrinogen-III synthase
MSEEPDTSIKVSKAARERLGLLASEQGITIRGLVEELAQARPTRAELKARGEAARTYLRDHMGIEVTGSDETAGKRLLEAIAARTMRQDGAAA